MSFRILLLIPAFLGITAVGLGAFGAHALRAQLESSGLTEVWKTAVLYHLVHAVALLAVALGRAASPLLGGSASLRWAGLCWTSGVLLFSGSLYALALGGPRWLGPITPLGGLLFIGGWLCVGIAGWKLGGRAQSR